MEDTEESFVPKTFETEYSQNCSTPKIKTGTENLSGSVGCTSDHNGEVFEFVKKNKNLDYEALVDAFKMNFSEFSQ